MSDSVEVSMPSHRSAVRRWIVQWARVIQVCAAIVIAGCLALFAMELPLVEFLRVLVAWVDATGVLGPLVYSLIYVVAVLLLVPGSLMAVMAGLVFGLWEGTLIVSLASAAGGAAAYGITRKLARQRVAAWVSNNPRFSALDRAIEKEGWRMVALVRLAPFIPYSMVNYVFGVTGIRFWPYVLTSWIAMLPGSFANVYIGYVGAAGLQMQERGPLGWAAIFGGLLLTIGIALLIVYRARRALQPYIEEAEREQPPTNGRTFTPLEQTARLRGAVIAMLGAAVAMTLTVYSLVQQDRVRRLIEWMQ